MKRVIVFSFVFLITGLSLITAGENRWTSHGPYGGEVGDFSFHPRLQNLIFARGRHGLYRSRDGGRSWQRVTDWYADRLLAVRFDPRNDASVISVDHGTLYGSSDCGSTWERMSELPDTIWDMEFHPNDPRILYAVTNRKGVYRSTDRGATWTPKNSGLGSIVREWNRTQLEVDPSNGRIIYVMLRCRNGVRVFKTTDGGELWKPASSGLHLGDYSAKQLVMNPKNPRNLYACGDGLFKTTDGGETWEGVRTYTFRFAIDPQYPATLYSTGYDGISKTTDAGSTWTDIAAPEGNVAAVAVHPSKSSSLFAGSWCEGIFRSTDGGKSWLPSREGLDQYDVPRVVLAMKPTKRLLAATEGGLCVSLNNGRTWRYSAIADEERCTFTDLQIHPANQQFLVGRAEVSGELTAGISSDGGTTWSLGTTIPNGYGFSPTGPGLALDPHDQKVIYLPSWHEASGSGVVKSTDQGETWHYVNSGLSDKGVFALCSDPRDGSILYAGTHGGKIFKTTDGGASWSDVSTGLRNQFVFDIAVDPIDSNRLYAAADDALYGSTDGGRTWDFRTYYAGRFVSVSGTKDRLVVTGGTGSLFVSADDGEHWSAFDSTGLGTFEIWDFTVDPSNSNRFFVGTARGVFEFTRKTVAPTAPLIEQLSPSSGRVGDSITIIGQRFGATQSASAVKFGTVDSGAAQSWSDKKIMVTVPTGVHNCSVTVTVSNKKSNPYSFIVLPPASGGKVEPTSGPATGGTRVTILAPGGTSGTEFNVLFGSALATNLGFTAPNIITCDSPPGTGTVDVKISQVLTTTTVGTFTYE